VPGLDTIIPEFEEGRLIVVESGADPAKSYFVRRIALTAHREGWPVTFVTSRDRRELEMQLAAEAGEHPWNEAEMTIVEQDSVRELEGLGGLGGLLAVDSFSFLTLDTGGPAVAHLLRNLRSVGRDQRTTIVLATDRGMFDPRTAAIVSHLADGVLEFHAKEGPEGLLRFMRVPKWFDGRIMDRNIHYEFDGKRIAVDLRRRVL